MRPKPNPLIEPYRVDHPVLGAGVVGEPIGFFEVHRILGACAGDVLRIIASYGGGWEHVSVSLADRCPTWEEMCYVKSLFWSDSETVLQYHPPKAEYINCHEFTLHLWRKEGEDAELPPAWMICPKTKRPATAAR